MPTTPANTPVVTRRYYPVLSSVLDLEAIPDELGFIKDSIVAQTVYITNTSDNYCTAVLHFGTGDSTIIYAYSNPRPNQFSYTYTDTGTYTMTLTALAGEEFVSYTNTFVVNADTTVAIREVYEENFEVKVYPNPTKSMINIAFNENIVHLNSEIALELNNTIGEKVLIKKLKTNIQKTQIDISSLSNGVYFINFYNHINNYLGTRRFVVVK